MLRRSGGACPAGRRAERRAARAPRGSPRGGPATPGQTISSRSRPRRAPASSVQLVGERDRLHHGDQLVAAVGRRASGPTNRPRLIFAGASARSAGVRRSQRERRRERAEVLRRQPLGARVGAAGRALRARRAPARASAPAPPPDSASEPASVLRRWAKAPATSARSAGGRRRGLLGRRSPPAHARRAPSRRSAPGRNTAARDRAHDPHLAGQLGEHRRRAVVAAARRRRQPLADLALDHRHPARHARQLLDRAQQHRRRRCRRAGWRRPSSGAGASAARSSVIASPQWTRDVRVRRRRVAQRLAQALVDLDDVHVRDALGEVLGEHAEAAADLQHDVARASSSAARSITPRMFESTGSSGRGRGRGARRSGASAAGSAGPRPRRSLRPPAAVTSRTRARRVALDDGAQLARALTPRSSARKASVCATKAGWLRSLAHRPAASGRGRRSRPAGGPRARSSAASARSRGALVGDVAGERDRVAAREALLQRARASRSSA